MYILRKKNKKIIIKFIIYFIKKLFISNNSNS